MLWQLRSSVSTCEHAMPSNLPDPDKIPDMSLDDRRDPPTGPSHPVDVSTSYQVNRHEPAQPAPAEPAPPPDWQEGDGVLAPWEPTFLYPGTIKQIIIDEPKGEQAHIEYDDGGEGQVFVYSLCPLEVKVGQEAQVRRN